MKTKIIVIDPCYLTANEDWQLMCKLADFTSKELKDPFDVIAFPRTVVGAYRDKDYAKHAMGRVIIHAISGTVNGDGSYDNISVDSGTLAVCEVDDALFQEHQQHCKQYPTVEEAIERMKFFCSQIKIFRFVEGHDKLNDILGMLSQSYVKHYGSLETQEGVFVEFVGSSNKPFTQSQLRTAVAADFEQVDGNWANVTNGAIAEFLK